jgi:hypothetical protein
MADPGTATDALTVVRDFIEAFNERDAEALGRLATGDVEIRMTGGEALRADDGPPSLIQHAEREDLRLVPLGHGAAEDLDGRVRVTLPVRELIGPDDIERIAEVEIRDGRVEAVVLRPLE